MFLLVLATASQPLLGQTNDSLSKRIGKISEESAAGDNFSGSVLLARNGKVIYKNSFGFADRKVKRKFLPETPSSIASIGKVLTAVLILKLAETGKLSLTDPISKFLPAANLVNADKITIKHLLTHTSGFGNYMEHQNYPKLQKSDFTFDDLIKLIADQQPVFNTPGEKFEYSNSGYIVLGKIIEIVTRKKYAEILKKEILKPLKMKNTHFEINLKNFQNTARGHRKSKKTGEWETDVSNRLPVFSSDGGIFTTAEDLFRFHRALFGGKIIKPETFNEMKKRQVETVIPELGKRAYGYGLMINDYENGVYSIGHNGGTFSFDARYKHFYKGQNEYTLIIISNYGDSIRPILKQVEKEILEYTD